MGRKSRNRQAQWDSHRRTQQDRTAPTRGVKVQPSKPAFVTGSTTATPRKPTVTQRKGINLKPFSDFVPGNDWAEAPAKVSAHGPAVLRPHWTSDAPHRQALDSETAGRYTRSTDEAADMAADSVSGMIDAQTYAHRHDADKAAGLYRDARGRIMRTTDMDDSMTTHDYATLHGVPSVRTKSQVRDDAAQARREKRDAEKAAREAERAAKREAREQDRAQRRLDRSSGKSGAGNVSRREMDEAARKVLAAHGVTSPTKIQMQAARDMIAHQKQVNQYTSKG